MILDTLTPPEVAPAMTDAVDELAQTLHDTFGDRALALTLFGAVTTPGFRADAHTAKSVLVLNQVDLPVLRQLADQGAKLGRLSLAAPLIMTPDYIRGSLDTFPLEFLEIMQRHVTVFGRDYFADLVLHEKELRLQCERELKVAGITLRQGLLASLGKENFIEHLERDLAEGLLRVLRGILWLKGERESRPGAEVVSRLESLVSHPLPGIRAALDDTNPAGWREFDLLYSDVDTLGKAVNDW